MGRKKRLLQDFGLYTFGELGSKFIGFILLPLYTKYLTVDDFGKLDLINTFSQLVLPVIYLQIQMGTYRFLLEKEQKKESILTTSVFFGVGSSLLFFFFAVLLNRFNLVKIEYTYLILSMYILNFCNSLINQILRGLDNVKLYSILTIVKTSIVMVCNIYFIAIKHIGYIGGVYSNIISAFVFVMFALYKTKMYKSIRIKYFNKKILSEMILYSVPLIPNTINWWIMNVSDRFVLGYYLGTGAVGIYALANKMSSSYFLINSMFNISWQTEAIKEYNSKDKDKYYSEVFNYFMIIQITIVLLGMNLIKPIFKIFIADNFYSAWTYVPILFMAAIFQSFSSFYAVGYLSSKKTKQAFFTTVYGGIINLILNLLFIPQFGIMAATLSTVLAYLIVWIIRIFTTSNFFKITIDKIKFFVGITFILSSFILMSWIDFKIAASLNVILFGLWLIINKDMILLLRGKIWKR